MTFESRWSEDDIQWGLAKVVFSEQDIIDSIKVACLVEARGELYGEYLSNVFCEDDEFKRTLISWGADEKKHGDVLKRWLKLADPAFEFETIFERYIEHAGWPISSNGESLRGSKVNELISRCTVESATSSFYFSIADRTKDELLRKICTKIAQDEIRHYRMFKAKLDSIDTNKTSTFQRLIAIVKRIHEGNDDQLSLAFFCAKGGIQYHKRSWSNTMQNSLYRVFNRKRLDDFVNLNMQVILTRKSPLLALIAKNLAWAFRNSVTNGRGA